MHFGLGGAFTRNGKDCRQVSILYFLGSFRHFFGIFCIFRLGTKGPFPWPIIGNVLEIKRAHPTAKYVSYVKMAEKYGDIFCFKMGMTDTGKVAGNFAVFSYNTQL